MLNDEFKASQGDLLIGFTSEEMMRYCVIVEHVERAEPSDKVWVRLSDGGSTYFYEETIHMLVRRGDMIRIPYVE
jgi:hypothetical protein